MTEIVVVEEPNRTVQDVLKRRKLQRLHLRKCNKKSKFTVPNIQLEKIFSSNDLQSRELNVFDVNMAYQHITGNFLNVFQESQVIRRILNPRYFQIPINMGAVDVSIFQVFVMKFFVRRH